MLPVRSRVSSREEHARIGREGRRFSCPPLVIHALRTGEPGPARAGFVVSRKVGPAVTRNRVRRRLREQVRSRLASVPPGTLLVVRALPASAEASSAELGGALDRGITALRSGRARPPRDRSIRRPAAAASAATRARPEPAAAATDPEASSPGGSASPTRGPR